MGSSEFLSEANGHAIAVSDYSAKELTVSEGERGRLLQLFDGSALIELEGNRVGVGSRNSVTHL